jgi:hypothetical protein
MKPWIVCAANRHKEDHSSILLGVRHCDGFMANFKDNLMIANEEAYRLEFDYETGWEQGFIDQFGNFYNRQEAWVVAEANGQIKRRVGGDTANGGTLYSENLY